MRKSNYLFDACVSHCNTQKLNKELNDFFDEEEAKFYTSYFNKMRKRNLNAFITYPTDIIVPLMTPENEKAFCAMTNIEWIDYSDWEDMDHNRDNFYWIILNEIESINYAQDIYDDDDPMLEEKHKYLSQLFNARYEGVVPNDIIRHDFCSHNDI
jgi:hypothetical protein